MDHLRNLQATHMQGNLEIRVVGHIDPPAFDFGKLIV
jgi:hypothetical protein